MYLLVAAVSGVHIHVLERLLDLPNDHQHSQRGS